MKRVPSRPPTLAPGPLRMKKKSSSNSTLKNSDSEDTKESALKTKTESSTTISSSASSIKNSAWPALVAPAPALPEDKVNKPQVSCEMAKSLILAKDPSTRSVLDLTLLQLTYTELADKAEAKMNEIKAEVSTYRHEIKQIEIALKEKSRVEAITDTTNKMAIDTFGIDHAVPEGTKAVTRTLLPPNRLVFSLFLIARICFCFVNCHLERHAVP
ncbi:hypothetical protein BJX99DRAFT_257076 [Aspergillus californicus]